MIFCIFTLIIKTFIFLPLGVLSCEMVAVIFHNQFIFLERLKTLCSDLQHLAPEHGAQLAEEIQEVIGGKTKKLLKLQLKLLR